MNSDHARQNGNGKPQVSPHGRVSGTHTIENHQLADIDHDQGRHPGQRLDQERRQGRHGVLGEGSGESKNRDETSLTAFHGQIRYSRTAQRHPATAQIEERKAFADTSLIRVTHSNADQTSRLTFDERNRTVALARLCAAQIGLGPAVARSSMSMAPRRSSGSFRSRQLLH
ncbi:hypothetical protein ACFWY5_56390 [Nonomuraea sp. NPDC059007]|uniref:hypothetical protein n=1 Tax=Nonomuraea sp. NPDC059007 TaxID=3346692 RepID=UPI00369AD964